MIWNEATGQWQRADAIQELMSRIQFAQRARGSGRVDAPARRSRWPGWSAATFHWD